MVPLSFKIRNFVQSQPMDFPSCWLRVQESFLSGAIETPQHGNGFKSEFGPFPSFSKNYRKSLKNWKVLRGLIWFDSRFFGVRFRFSKKVSNSQFPLFWVCFLIFWVIFRMYIKLLVLVGFDLHFPLISGISKLHLVMASFPNFQLSLCFIFFIIVIHFTLTTKKLNLF